MDFRASENDIRPTALKLMEYDYSHNQSINRESSTIFHYMNFYYKQLDRLFHSGLDIEDQDPEEIKQTLAERAKKFTSSDIAKVKAELDKIKVD